MVATWDDSEDETSDDEDQQEMSNLAFMVFREEQFDELDEISDSPTYDELFDAFKELHDDYMRISKINTCLKKKMIELSTENDSLSAKTTSVELL